MVAASPVVLRELHVATDDDGATVTARVLVDPADPYLCGHFPGNPVYPGVFLLDLMERAVAAATPPGTRLLTVESARFTAPARERADVELSVRVPHAERNRTAAATFTGDGTRFANIRAVFGSEHPAVPLSRADIHRLLPHGHPMILVDAVTRLVPGQEIESVKAVTVSEPCYAGLTADAPDAAWAFPSSLLVESFGQSAVLLWRATHGTEVDATDVVPMLAVIRHCRFLGQAYPGDVLRHYVRLDHSGPNTAIVSGRTAVAGCTIAAFGELMAVAATARNPDGVLDSPRTNGKSTN